VVVVVIVRRTIWTTSSQKLKCYDVQTFAALEEWELGLFVRCVCVVVCWQTMGCICVHPPKQDNNGVGPSQPANPTIPHPSTSQPVGPESVVVKPPPPAVPPKKRKDTFCNSVVPKMSPSLLLNSDISVSIISLVSITILCITDYFQFLLYF